MLALLCLFSSFVGLACAGWVIWIVAYKRGVRDAWQDITDEFRRYD